MSAHNEGILKFNCVYKLKRFLRIRKRTAVKTVRAQKDFVKKIKNGRPKQTREKLKNSLALNNLFTTLLKLILNYEPYEKRNHFKT